MQAQATHPIRCRCGTMRGYVDDLATATRGVCYCKDCQAFARFLGDGGILDEQGGTEVVQTLAPRVNLTDGIEALACVRLTPKGLYRWYARCCNTPIGNTPPNYKIAYVGLVHNCLESNGRSLAAAFGPIRMRVNTRSAFGESKPKAVGLVSAIARIAREVIGARVSGAYKRTPFFSPESGQPVVVPRVLSAEERDRVRLVT
jgi:hypothetical protein